MYAAPFEYHVPTTLAEALSLLERFGEEAKLLAGGQSLIPLMKFRLTTPAHLIDLRKVGELVGIREGGGEVRIGAMTPHGALVRSEALRGKVPVLNEAAALVGDEQVRNLGTIGGSLAHADPAADWPAVTVALGASVQVVSRRGERSLKVEDFVQGPLTTALGPGEILVAVRVPLPEARTGAAYEKLRHPASGFALVGVASTVTLEAGGAVRAVRVAITGLGPKVTRASAVEQALQGKVPEASVVEAAARSAAEGLTLRDDLTGSADYQRHLAAVYTARSLRRAVERAQAAAAGRSPPEAHGEPTQAERA